MFEQLQDVITLFSQTLSQRIADNAGLALVQSNYDSAVAQIPQVDQALLDKRDEAAAALAHQKDMLAADDAHLADIMKQLSAAALDAAAKLVPPAA